jgi:pentatricopeptide repeat domain-containing protein 1
MIKINVLSRIVARQLFARRITVNYALPTSKFASQIFRKYSSEIPVKDNIRDFIATQDPDTFGSLNVNVEAAEDELVDEGDIKEEEYSKHPPKRSQKLSTKQYADMIKEHLKYRRIKEALNVLEVRMLKEDRVKPENYIFNLLIDGCAKEGFSRQAFNLFTKMRQRGLKVTGATYTSLFNACANAPWAQDGLNKSRRLREIMLEKGYEPNISNYNAMIKAFGRCNDLKTAFLIVDEMTDKNLLIDVETFNFMLQGCVSDKEFGFRHALLVWHKMYQRRLRPDIYSFNLMLRCCRDTQFGDVESMEQVLQTILLGNPEKEQIKLEGHSSSEGGKLVASGESDDVHADPTPNLLLPRPHLGNLISLSEVTKPEDKFLLLGGFSGFLETMKNFDVKPDLKTYTELIEVIPSTRSAETRLLKQVKKQEVKCDVDFFNILMKKRCVRFDYEGGKEVLDMIEKVNLEPDIVTYGVLALGCQTHEEALALMKEMESKGIKMNMQILGAMLKTACIKKNFDYVIDVLNIIKGLSLKPSQQMLDTLDFFVKVCNKQKKRDFKKTGVDFRNDYNSFKQKLDNWKLGMGLGDLEFNEAKKILKEAPWEQFQEVQADGYEAPKGKNLQTKSKYKRYTGKIKHNELEVQ